ncbi:MAG: hypothetical protein SWZ49_21710 [Cyanobacteriota bacterium]|nr:hypothetical protein [Cyanobacteriota bacterium]
MEEILKLIKTKEQEFAQLELFKFFGDTRIQAKERMIWVPYIAPLVMGFAELNKSVFRKEGTNNKLQELINKHTYEDDYHWTWFLEDIQTLGFDNSLLFTDALRFIWSEETKCTRKVCQQIAMHTWKAEPIIVVVAIESVEAAFKVGLSAISPVIEELERVSDCRFYYFGQTHAEIENNHSNNSSEVKSYIQEIELTAEQKVKAREIVNLVFQLFTDCMNELMLNTRKQLEKAEKLDLIVSY